MSEPAGATAPSPPATPDQVAQLTDTVVQLASTQGLPPAIASAARPLAMIAVGAMLSAPNAQKALLIVRAALQARELLHKALAD